MKRQVKKFSQFIRESREEEDFGPEITGETMGDYDEDERRERRIGQQLELEFPGEYVYVILCLGTASDALDMKWGQIHDGLQKSGFAPGGILEVKGERVRNYDRDELSAKVRSIRKGESRDGGQLYYQLVSRCTTKIYDPYGRVEDVESRKMSMKDAENLASGFWAEWCANNDCRDPKIRVYDLVTNKKIATL